MRHCHGRLFLEGGSESVSNIFPYKGSQYNDYGVIQMPRHSIVEDVAPNIVDAPLTLISRTW